MELKKDEDDIGWSKKGDGHAEGCGWRTEIRKLELGLRTYFD
jgi:hypothetical protein